MLAVVLGLCALAVGPLVGPLLQRHARLAAAVDGFVVVTVTGLVVLHVLPQSVTLVGPAALPLAGLGLVVPALLHRFDAAQRPAVWRGSRDAVALAVLLLAAFGHALLDGVALVDGTHANHGEHGEHDGVGHGSEHGGGHGGEHGGEHGTGLSALALAVLLHRLPYGLALWVIGRERLGLPRTLAVLGALAAGTVVGAVVGDQLVSPGAASALAWVQAFAAGAVLHVLLEAPAVDVRGGHRASVLGVVCGLAVLALLARSHPVIAVVVDELSFPAAIVVLAGAVAPAALAGLAMVGLAAALRGGRRVLLRGRSLLAGLASAVVAAAQAGLCGCRVGGAFDVLLLRRAGVAPAVAFLVLAPQLEPAQLIVSWQLLGPALTAVRLVVAVVVAVVVALVVDGTCGRSLRAARGDLQAADGAVAVDGPPRGTAVALRDAADHVAPWLLLGLVVAAFLEPLVAPTSLGWVSSLPTPWMTLAVAFAAMPVYLCAPAALPVAAVLLHKGVPPGAVTAFLVVGPAASVTTLGLLARRSSRRAAVVFALALCVAVAVGGVAVDAFAPDLARATPSLHERAAAGVSPATTLSVLVALVVVGWSLVRQGVRGFLTQILHPIDDARGGHVHGPHCGHSEHARTAFGRKAPVARVRIDVPVDGAGR